MKTKRTLVSLAVFLSVFCLSMMSNISEKIFNPWTSASNVDNSVSSRMNDISMESNTSVAAALDNALSFKERRINLNEEKDYVPFASNNQTIDETQIKDDAQNNAEPEEFDLDEVAIESENKDATTKALATKGPAKVEAKYANIGIAAANSYVNIRKEASTDSTILGKLYKDAAAEILENHGDWYYIESGSVKGYVSSDYVRTGIPDDELIATYAKLSIQVMVDGLNVRKEPDTDANRVTVIYKNEVYPVIEMQDDWIKIDITDENKFGYISKEYAELIAKFKNAVSKEEEQELARLAQEKEQEALHLAKEKEQERKSKLEKERIKKETEVKQREETAYSDEDLKLLACLVHSEAGSQSYEGKLAVANVVLNRVKSSKYPSSIKNVIYHRGQFSVATSGSLKKQLNNYKNYSSNAQRLSIKAAKAALNGDNNIGKRLYFNSYKAAVAKGYDRKSNSVKLDDHLFW